MSRGLGALALGLLVAGPLQGQEFKGPIWGGSGGTSSYNLDCGSTGIITGIYGKSGFWIDQVGIICRTVNADGNLGSTYTKGPAGGSGGTASTVQCPSGRILGGLRGAAGSYMEQLDLGCFPWSASTKRADYTVSWQMTRFGNLMAVQLLTKVQCPDEKVGKALRGKSGSYIDSMQFVCDAYNK